MNNIVDKYNNILDATGMSEELVAVLMDTLPDTDGAAYDNSEDSALPELEDALNLHVGYLAHWRTPSLVWAGDGVGPRGWDSLAWSIRRYRLISAKDKAAFPYLWNAKRQRVSLDNTRSYNAARGRMLAASTSNVAGCTQ